MAIQTDWNSLLGYLRPHTLRQMREDLRHQPDDNNKQILEPFIEEIDEMLSVLEGEQAVSKEAGFV